MRDDYAAQFLVGAATAAAAAVFNLAVNGQVEAGWVLLAFGVPFTVLQAYQRAGFTRVRAWRVGDNELQAQAGAPTGHGAWALEAGERRDWAVRGPRRPLGQGRYRAAFRLKIDSLAGDEVVLELDVAARHGRKVLALRALTVQDFRQADTYQDFPLDFYLLHDDNDVEYRLSARGGPRRLTFDRVTVSRRLF